MAFRFSLETVLRLRRSLEEVERLRLQKLHGERAQIEGRLSETTSAQASISGALRLALGSSAPLPGAELQFSAQRLSACELEQQRLSAAAAALAHHIERQKELVLERQLHRKVLEQLRDRQRLASERKTERRVQSGLEELFLLRRFGERMRD